MLTTAILTTAMLTITMLTTAMLATAMLITAKLTTAMLTTRMPDFPAPSQSGSRLRKAYDAGTNRSGTGKKRCSLAIFTAVLD
jgi:hypothetical protein